MGGYAGDSGDSAPHGTPPQRAPAQRVMDAAPLLGVQFLRREGRGHLQPAHGQQLGARRRRRRESVIHRETIEWGEEASTSPSTVHCIHLGRNFLNDVWVKYDC